MPKIKMDAELQQEVQRFVAKEGGVSQAALRLGIHRTTLWRFNKSGCAIDRTRQAIARAMKRNKSETRDIPVAETRTKSSVLDSISIDDLNAIRSFCKSMIALVDVYEHLARESSDMKMPKQEMMSAKFDISDKAGLDRRS